MAPRKKEKEDKPSANEAADMVLRYLRKQNRPYSAIDVSANLHNKVTKAGAAKILKDLHEQRQIEGRASGKQTVYHALQDPADAFSPEQLQDMTTEISTLNTETASLTTQAKTLRTAFSTLNSSLSTADLLSSVSILSTEKTRITKRLEALRAGKAKKVSKEEREKVESEWKKMRTMAKKRAKLSQNVWGFIADQDMEREVREDLREAFELDG